MSAPLIWIIIPAALSMIAFLMRRWKVAITIFLTVFSLFLALLAWRVPLDELITIGSTTFTISDRIVFAGRQFILGNSDRSLLFVIYMTLTFFFFGSLFANVSTFFVPLGLGMCALLIASLSVQPFLYAALIIQVAVLVGVPLLSPPGKKIEIGVLRYMVFLSFGFPFLLVGGDLLSSSNSMGTNLEAIFPALIILGFGFAFLLAIFPLNTWIPVLLERTHPYPSIFVLYLSHTVVIALLMRFFLQYPWMNDIEIIKYFGVLMVFTSGLWAAFQRNLGRILGYAFAIEIGYSLISISLVGSTPIYIALFLPRILALGVWALALSFLLKQVDQFSFRSVQGLGRRLPLVVSGIIIANFSLAGFPLLASFPFLLSLWSQLATFSDLLTLFALLGNVGLLIGALRSFAVFVMGPEDMPPVENTISWPSRLILLLGIVFIVLVGIMPHGYIGLFSRFVGL
jgi:formate hydrogenlyase subunit 3/multisubunit Na+/H+ antiporter MnhD subunit